MVRSAAKLRVSNHEARAASSFETQPFGLLLRMRRVADGILPTLAPADQNARRQHQRSAEHDLKRRAQERRFHEVVLDPGDRP